MAGPRITGIEVHEYQFTLEELWQAYDKGEAGRFQAAVDLARADPKSDAGFAALEWVLTIPRAYYLPAGKPAMELARSASQIFTPVTAS